MPQVPVRRVRMPGRDSRQRRATPAASGLGLAVWPAVSPQWTCETLKSRLRDTKCVKPSAVPVLLSQVPKGQWDRHEWELTVSLTLSRVCVSPTAFEIKLLSVCRERFYKYCSNTSDDSAHKIRI